MGKHCLIVANQSQAKFYFTDRKLNKLESIESLEHPEGRKQNREMADDKPGREFEEGSEGRHTLPQAKTETEKEAEIFAQEIAEHTNRIIQQQALDDITLVAAPRMLGYIRAQLKPDATDLIHRSIDKDIAQLTDEEIREHVQSAA